MNDQSGYLNVAGLFFSTRKCASQPVTRNKSQKEQATIFPSRRGKQVTRCRVWSRSSEANGLWVCCAPTRRTARTRKMICSVDRSIYPNNSAKASGPTGCTSRNDKFSSTCATLLTNECSRNSRRGTDKLQRSLGVSRQRAEWLAHSVRQSFGNASATLTR